MIAFPIIYLMPFYAVTLPPTLSNSLVWYRPLIRTENGFVIFFTGTLFDC